jgi:hypothetical protein
VTVVDEKVTVVDEKVTVKMGENISSNCCKIV